MILLGSENMSKYKKITYIILIITLIVIGTSLECIDAPDLEEVANSLQEFEYYNNTNK